MEWEQHTYSMRFEGCPLSVRVRWAAFRIKRAMMETQDITLKKMYADITGEPVYHHGNKV